MSNSLLSPDHPVFRAGIVAVTLVLLAGVGWYVKTTLERRAEVRELVQMRDSMAELRAATDRCASDLAREEAAFRRFDARVDSLREIVDDYESRDPEGVPGEEYERYLSAFDRYNEAVTEWERLADTLRSAEAECRELVEEHNALATELRVRLDRAGVGDGASPGPPEG